MIYFDFLGAQRSSAAWLEKLVSAVTHQSRQEQGLAVDVNRKLDWLVFAGIRRTASSAVQNEVRLLPSLDTLWRVSQIAPSPCDFR